MTVREWLAEWDEEILMADGYEEAMIGVAQRCGQPALAVYDVEKCLDILVKRDGMSEIDALEFFEFNVTGAWAGEHTPLFLWKKPDELEH